MYGGDLNGIFSALIVLALAAGAVIAGLLLWLVPMVWAWIKPWLHMVTA